MRGFKGLSAINDPPMDKQLRTAGGKPEEGST